MRVALGCSVLLLLVLTGMAVAQDTNFDRGPQYLLTNGSPMFAQPIATPIMSLPAPAREIGASDSTEGLAAGAENGTIMPPAPALPDLFPIYYGRAWVNEIRMSSPAQSIELPAGLLDDGVGQVTSSQALVQQGYGLTLAQAAAQAKARARHAGRVYTNEDVNRLRKSG